MSIRWLLIGTAFLLTGCATTSTPPMPATLALDVSNERVLPEAAALFMAYGYVIRDSDSREGRLEAVIARWPGYRVEVSHQPLSEGTRVNMRAWRGSQSLSPALVQPWLDRLAIRLGGVTQAPVARRLPSDGLVPIDGVDQRQ